MYHVLYRLDWIEEDEGWLPHSSYSTESEARNVAASLRMDRSIVDTKVIDASGVEV